MHDPDRGAAAATEPVPDGPPPQLRLFSAWLIVPLAVAAGLLVWLRPAQVPWATSEPLLLMGVTVSVCLWLLAVARAMNGARAEQERRELKVVRERETLIAEPAQAKPVQPVRLTAWPPLLLLVLGLAVTGALRFLPDGVHLLRIELAPVAGIPVELSGQAVLRVLATGVLGIVTLAAVGARRRAWRFGLERHAAEGTERLAAEALNGMPVMISICSPEGERRRFNSRYLEVMGAGAAAARVTGDGVLGGGSGAATPVAGIDDARFAGRAWFDLVHEDDRELFDKVFGQSASKKAANREIEYGVALPEIGNRWIRERFVARRGADGELAGYLAVGIDITAQVENETENARLIADLRDENHEQHEHIEEIEEEVGRLNAEVAALTKARDRIQEKLDAAKETARTADDRVGQAKEEAGQARAEMREMKAAHSQMKAEHRKMSQALARAEREVESLRRKEAALEARVEKHGELLEKSKATATEARQKESQLRVKVSKLTTRCQDLKEQLDGALDEQSQTAEEIEARKAAAEQQAARQVERFAADMRGRIADVCQMVQRVRFGSVAESHLAELENAQASMASLAIMFDGALGATADEAWPVQGECEQRAFDVRNAARSVARMLAPTAAERGVKLDCTVAPDFPPHLTGDPVRTREAWLLLAERTLQVVESGTVTIRLSHSGAGPALVAARCEISHDSAKIDSQRLRILFAMDEGAEERLDGDSGLFESAVAWRLLKVIGADYGLEVEQGGGFTIWFSMSLARPHMTDQDGPGVAGRAESSAEAATDAGDAGSVAAAGGHAPRLPQELVKSNLGEVKELGQTSARILSTKELEGVVDLVIEAGEGGPLRITAEVESCHRDGMRHYDVILSFLELTPALRAKIAQVALTNRRSSTIESVGAPK